jgi:hypothetical protein
MEKEKITFGVSVPNREIVDLVDTMADMHNVSRSQQIVSLIRAEAEKLGLITKRLSGVNGSAQK